MKTIKYVPEALKKEDAKLEGSLTLRLPTFDEKFDYIDQSGLELSEDGAIDLKTLKLKDRVKVVRLFVNLSKAHYLKVEMKHKETGEEYTSFEDLSCEPDAEAMLAEVGMQLINGFKLGKV